MKSTNQIFIDANIFTYLLTDHPVYGRSCFELMEKVELGDTTGFISPLVIDEVAYILMIQKARTITGKMEIKNAKRVLAKIWNECLEPVNEFYRYLDQLISMGNLIVLNLDYSISRISLECAREYNLFPRDALHAACCKAYGIKKMATNDGDFLRVEFLEILRPG